MANIILSDMTMKQVAEGFSLSFKEKIELSKLLDKLGVSVIELEGIENARVDSLRIKSIAAAVMNSVVAVPVQLSKDGPEQAWAAAHKKARIRGVCLFSRLYGVFHQFFVAHYLGSFPIDESFPLLPWNI